MRNKIKYNKFMSNAKQAAKDKQLDIAIDQMEEASQRVRQLTADLDRGIVTKSEVEKAIAEVNKKAAKVQILSAESKMLGEWMPQQFGEGPSETSFNWWIVVAVLSALYLLKK
jgi:hypothetical protein